MLKVNKNSISEIIKSVPDVSVLTLVKYSPVVLKNKSVFVFDDTIIEDGETLLAIGIDDPTRHVLDLKVVQLKSFYEADKEDIIDGSFWESKATIIKIRRELLNEQFEVDATESDKVLRILRAQNELTEKYMAATVMTDKLNKRALRGMVISPVMEAISMFLYIVTWLTSGLDPEVKAADLVTNRLIWLSFFTIGTFGFILSSSAKAILSKRLCKIKNKYAAELDVATKTAMIDTNTKSVKAIEEKKTPEVFETEAFGEKLTI
jgi:hypothetical protein